MEEIPPTNRPVNPEDDLFGGGIAPRGPDPRHHGPAVPGGVPRIEASPEWIPAPVAQDDLFGGGPSPYDLFGGMGPAGGYRGPRVGVPSVPPPRPYGERSRRRKPLVAALAVVVLVAAGATAVLSRYSGNPPSRNGSESTAGTGSPDLPGSQSGTSHGSNVSWNKPNVRAITAELDPSVVDITSELAYEDGEAAGTGMVLTPNGEVLTNNHVIDGAVSITVQISGAGRRYPAYVLGTDPTADVALIQLEGASDLRPTTFGDSSRIGTGEPVVAIGNALDLPGPPKVTEGTITALDRPIIAQDTGTALCENLSGMIQTDASLEPGNSGGPLIDPDGQVIGINTAAAASGKSGKFATSGSKTGFAIPIDVALEVVDDIRDDRPTASVHVGPSPLLGVQVTGVDGQGTGTECSSSGNSSSIGLGPEAPVSSGALVVNVGDGSPAFGAGIQVGDAITSFDSHKVTTAEDLTRLVQAMKPGAHVEVGWVDLFGQTHVASVVLATGPAD